MIRTSHEARDASNAMKIIDELSARILAALPQEDIFKDKIREIFASYRCCALTTKGEPCSCTAKEKGFCGRHSGKVSRKCCHVRTDASECSLNATDNSQYCWLHASYGAATKPSVSRKKSPRRVVIVEDNEEPEVVPIASAAPEPEPEVVPIAAAAPEPEVVPIASAAPEPEPEVVPIAAAAPEPARDYSCSISWVEKPPFSVPLSEGCTIINDSGKNRGQVCGVELKPGKFVCTKHKSKNLPRKGENARVAYTCGAMEELCSISFATSDKKESLTKGYREHDIAGDEDSLIDEANALPKFKAQKCIYLQEDGYLCHEPVYKDSYMCKEHRKYSKQYQHNSGTNKHYDPFWEPKRVFLEDVSIVAPGHKWFPNLNFYAHITRKGPIVVGKAHSIVFPESLEGCNVRRDVKYTKDGFAEELTEEELEKWLHKYPCDNDPISDCSDDLIRRCHNNGLLYKVIPQEVLHRQFNLPSDLDTIRGRGFTSFEQMIRERPQLYIKYWNVWLGHIRRAKEFTKYMGCNLETFKRHFNVWEAPNWEEYYRKIGPKIGLFHVEVPAPELEDVERPGFNPFKYCRDWVRENLPEKINEAWYPPMYILYPFPLEYYEEKYYHENRLRVEDICDKHLYAHYNFRSQYRNSVESWMQWLKYGEHEGQFARLYAFKTVEDVFPQELKEAVERAELEKAQYKDKLLK